jgi:hypothetical protein
MARSDVGYNPRAFDRIKNHHAENESGELAIARLFELFGFSAEQQLSYVATTCLRRFLNEFPTRMINPRGPHTWLL